MQQPQQPGKILRWIKVSERLPDEGDKRPVRRKSHNDYTWILVKNDYVSIDVDEMDMHFPAYKEFIKGWEWLEETEDLSAPAPPVEENAEEFEIWANEYTNKIMADSPRAFREHLGAEIHSALSAAYKKLIESKPSSVIEGVETNIMDPETTDERTCRKLSEWYLKQLRECQEELRRLKAPPVIEIGEVGEIPEDIAEFILSISKGTGGDCYIIAACEKLYHKMHEEIAQVVENAVSFSRLSVEQANKLASARQPPERTGHIGSRQNCSSPAMDIGFWRRKQLKSNKDDKGNAGRAIKRQLKQV